MFPINIYWVLKDKNNDFSSYKKKCISLYLACFFMDDELKSIISENDKIIIDGLLSRLDLKKSDIKTLKDKDYKELYDTFFKTLLNLMYASESSYLCDVIEATPETMMFLIYMDIDSSNEYGENCIQGIR